MRINKADPKAVSEYTQGTIDAKAAKALQTKADTFVRACAKAGVQIKADGSSLHLIHHGRRQHLALYSAVEIGE